MLATGWTQLCHREGPTRVLMRTTANVWSCCEACTKPWHAQRLRQNREVVVMYDTFLILDYSLKALQDIELQWSQFVASVHHAHAGSSECSGLAASYDCMPLAISLHGIHCISLLMRYRRP